MNKIFLTPLLLVLLSNAFSQNYRAVFAWEMGPRIDEANSYYEKQKATYNKRMLSEEDGWVVRFDASESKVPYRDRLYTWTIEGVGPLANYKKTFSSLQPKLFAQKLLNPTGISRTVAVSYVQLDKNKNTKKAPGGPNDDQVVVPVHPNPSALITDRFPKIGEYNITLTISPVKIQKGTTNYVYKETIKLKNIIIACIGDSFNSGEGNPDKVYDADIPCSTTAFNLAIQGMEAGLGAFLSSEIPYYSQIKNYITSKNNGSFFPSVSSPNIWHEPRAHRSLLSGPSRAARLVEFMDPHSAVTFITFATSGAMIERGLISPQYSWQPAGQLDQLKQLLNGKKIDFLLMSIGINDVALTEILADAVLRDFTRQKAADVKRLMDDLRLRYDGLQSFLTNRLNVSKTIITTYPAPIFTITAFSGISLVEKPSRFPFSNPSGHIITDVEAPILTEVANYLNGMITLAAQKNGWLLANPSDAFRGHGYSSETPYEPNARSTPSYYVRLSESCNNQADYKGMVHPNALGHEVYAEELSSVMKPFVAPAPPQLAPRPRTVRVTITSITRLHKNSYRGIGERFNTELNYPVPLPANYDQSGVQLHVELGHLKKDTVMAALNGTVALNGFSIDMTVTQDESRANMYLTFKDRSTDANLLGIYYDLLYLWNQSYGNVSTKTGKSKISYSTYDDGTETDIELFEIAYRFELVKDDNPVIR